MFFLRLQAETGTTLYEHESLIIFDEVQLFPKARQAIKHLVADGRYSYLETGSLISIRKNVKDILIPSEEMKIQVYPMDYEEFCDATGGNFELLRQIFGSKRAIGQATNRKLMRDLRVYMAVGGMPQAVEAYINGKNFSEIDMTRIKAHLGPWPRALEKAGLKEPKKSVSPTKHPHHKAAAKKAKQNGKDIL